MSPEMIAVLLLLAGFGLLFLEILLPTAGVLGFLAAVMLISSVTYGFMKCSFGMGTALLVIAVGIVPFVIALAVKVWPHTPIGKMILLDSATDEIAHSNKNALIELVGRQGIAQSRLLPGGVAEIDGRRWDVVIIGPVADQGDLIEVVEVEGNRIMVSRVDDDAAEPEKPVVEEPTESLSSRNDAIFEDDPFA
ncbi:NfeD family protein [Bremerella cremea]|uniref:NfeD family protein n=1 Tax=Bremerella cremea TaxID=1031537 RepID=UPI0031E62A52